jgi:hypothetical protein
LSGVTNKVRNSICLKVQDGVRTSKVERWAKRSQKLKDGTAIAESEKWPEVSQKLKGSATIVKVKNGQKYLRK